MQCVFHALLTSTDDVRATHLLFAVANLRGSIDNKQIENWMSLDLVMVIGSACMWIL